VGPPIASAALADGSVPQSGVAGPGIRGSEETRLELYSAAPNPFAETTTLRYELPAEGRVSIGVYDLAGREVRPLVDRVEKAGPHSLTLYGRDERGERLRPGLYLVRLDFAGERSVRRIVLSP